MLLKFENSLFILSSCLLQTCLFVVLALRLSFKFRGCQNLRWELPRGRRFAKLKVGEGRVGISK